MDTGAECEGDMFPCYYDCCIRNEQFCNHDPDQQRCWYCSSREVYCTNQTKLPPECGLHCYLLNHGKDLQDNQTYLTHFIVVAAILGVLLLLIVGYFIRNKMKNRHKGAMPLDDNSSIQSDQSALLDANKDADQDLGQDNDAAPTDSAALDENNVGETFGLSTSRPQTVDAGSPDETSVADLVGAQPFDHSVSPNAPPIPIRPESARNGCIPEEENQPMEPQAQANGPREDAAANQQNTQHDCRDPRLYNVIPSEQRDSTTAFLYS